MKHFITSFIAVISLTTFFTCLYSQHKKIQINDRQRTLNYDLVAAARSNNIDLVRSLLAKKADPEAVDATGEKALVAALKHDNLKMIHALWFAKTKYQLPDLPTGLQLMAFTGSWDPLRMCLAHKRQRAITVESYNDIEAALRIVVTRDCYLCHLVIDDFLKAGADGLQQQDKSDVEHDKILKIEAKKNAFAMIVHRFKNVGYHPRSYKEMLDVFARHQVVHKDHVVQGLTVFAKHPNIISLIAEHLYLHPHDGKMPYHMFDAVKRCDQQCLDSFTERGGDINACDRDGNTLFMFAVASNNVPMITYCVSKRRHVFQKNKNNCDVFDIAQNIGNKEAISCLESLKEFFEIKCKMLFDEIGKNRDDYDMRQLLNEGADPNRYYEIRETKSKITPLSMAIYRRCDLSILTSLIWYKADVNKSDIIGTVDCSLLWLAVNTNDAKYVQFFLDHGVEVNNRKDNWLILNLAIRQDNPQIIRLLFVNGLINDFLYFHTAVRYKKIRTFKLLFYLDGEIIFGISELRNITTDPIIKAIIDNPKNLDRYLTDDERTEFAAIKRDRERWFRKKEKKDKEAKS